MIDRGSSISLHNYQHFFLIFKNTRTGILEYRFDLPPPLNERLQEMYAFANTPREQKALRLEHQAIRVSLFCIAHYSLFYNEKDADRYIYFT